MMQCKRANWLVHAAVLTALLLAGCGTKVVNPR